MRGALAVTAAAVVYLGAVATAAAQTSHRFERVCVDVVMKSWNADSRDSAGDRPRPARKDDRRPRDEAPAPSKTRPESRLDDGRSWRGLFAAPGDTQSPQDDESSEAPPSTPAAAAPFDPPATPDTKSPSEASIADDLEAALSNATRSQPKRAARDESAAILPELYLERLLEYEVTHHALYEAVSEDCPHRLIVELYPLDSGWTVFARFSRYAREEKVDHVEQDELASLASRLASSLLHDRPITETITRLNVLRADSEAHVRSIRGRSHVVTGFGTSARFGNLPSAGDSVTSAEDELRLVTPLSFTAGYRGKFRSWGLEAFGRFHVGTSERSASANRGGGHADFSGGGGLGLHFLYYADAAGMNSLYFGGGATFELLRFALIRPEGDRRSDPRAALWSGGLNVDVVLGYEFMRASAIHFYTAIEANLPTYALQDDNAAGSVSTYWPGLLAQVGMLF